ncbi:hypothetical protein CYMTET_36248 [Cymbomonas tetramitiformis]|uniref:SIAH-type domain-containing protein n=1 Tax=Cymbomonas tetramitiformis TaxID=36881 RepID=A0AAE0CI26_9CHLO|nr:hypothetical protein CYMTET_36248 [Cymbomonas tetramitiformis]
MFDTATSVPARSAWLEGTLRAQEKECRDQLSKDILGTGRRDSTVLWKASSDEASCNCVSSVLDPSPSICIGLGNATTKVLRVSIDGSKPAPQVLKVDAHEEFRGHRGYVSCILSLTKLVITGSFDGTVCIWRVEDGLLMGISDHHQGPIHNLSFDMQSRSLFSVSSDKTLRCLDLNNGNSRVVCNNLGREIMCCMATPRPHYPNLPWAIYAGSEDGMIFGVDGDTGKKLIKFTGHTDIVQKLALLGAAGQMLSGCRDNSVRRWCLRSGSCLFTYTSHTGPVFDLIPIRSGSECLSASKDGTVQRWDIVTGLVQQTYHGHNGAIFGMCITPSPVGCKLVTAGRDRTLRVWQPLEECEFCVTRCIGSCPYVRQTVQRCLGCEVDLTASQGEHRRGCTEVPRPCQFAQFGCEEMLGGKDMVTHESLCDFRPMRCPNSILGCPHEAPAPNIPAHALCYNPRAPALVESERRGFQCGKEDAANGRL